MSITRLTQQGTGGKSYSWPADVDLSTANWGWTAYPIGVQYTPSADTRLGQMGVAASAYQPASNAKIVDLTTDTWGWTSYPITIPGESILLDTANWGWTSHNPTICGQDPSSYAYSFNSDVWPSCVHNDYVFGPRTATEIDLAADRWGWQTFPITVQFQDPIDVGLQLANWGWTSLPFGVSYAYDVGLQVSAWGWQPLNITVEIPYDIDLSLANWGWRSLPIGVSYGYDVGLVTAVWGWQSFPLTIDVPSFDIRLRKQDWGWESFPVTVQQTTLQPGDIDAIAQAVYDKLVTEGMVQQVLETWMRQGCDPNYPQDIPMGVGKYINCGGMSIYIERLPDGTIRQTRQ